MYSQNRASQRLKNFVRVVEDALTIDIEGIGKYT